MNREEIAQAVAALLGSAPADLAALYVSGDLPEYPDSRICVLPFARALDYSRDMHGIAVVERLGLWVLDDAEDSNPYGYVTRGPCAGCIMHFTHDGEPRISHANLANFIAALHALGEAGADIDELAPDPLRIDLDDELLDLANEGSDDATFLVNAYLPASGPLRADTQAALLVNDDFFVREALALHLARHPRVEDADTARQLAADQHPQVAAAGKRAVGALRRIGVR